MTNATNATAYRLTVAYLEACSIESARAHAGEISRKLRQIAKGGKTIDKVDTDMLLDAMRKLDEAVENYRKRTPSSWHNNCNR